VRPGWRSNNPQPTRPASSRGRHPRPRPNRDVRGSCYSLHEFRLWGEVGDERAGGGSHATWAGDCDLDVGAALGAGALARVRRQQRVGRLGDLALVRVVEVGLGVVVGVGVMMMGGPYSMAGRRHAPVRPLIRQLPAPALASKKQCGQSRRARRAYLQFTVAVAVLQAVCAEVVHLCAHVLQRDEAHGHTAVSWVWCFWGQEDGCTEVDLRVRPWAKQAVLVASTASSCNDQGSTNQPTRTPTLPRWRPQRRPQWACWIWGCPAQRTAYPPPPGWRGWGSLRHCGEGWRVRCSRGVGASVHGLHWASSRRQHGKRRMDWTRAGRRAAALDHDARTHPKPTPAVPAATAANAGDTMSDDGLYVGCWRSQASGTGDEALGWLDGSCNCCAGGIEFASKASTATTWCPERVTIEALGTLWLVATLSSRVSPRNRCHC